jgi:toxin ParE1/3/4
MSRVLRLSDDFLADLNLQTDWYVRKAGVAKAEEFGDAVDNAIQRVARFPSVGIVWDRPEPELTGFRYLVLDRPFNRFLLFYRVTETSLEIERVIHGMRDLPRRFLDRPGTERP